jgi:hypothetical protein
MLKLIEAASSLEFGQHDHLLRERFRSLRVDANAGEEVLAFECLCDNLFEFDIRFSAAFLDQIDSAAQSLGVPSERYEFVRELIT